MKKYLVYLDGSKNVYKLAIPAKNEAEARKLADGNGGILFVEDVTKECQIDLGRVAIALYDAHFTQIEIAFIIRCLEINDIAR